MSKQYVEEVRKCELQPAGLPSQHLLCPFLVILTSTLPSHLDSFRDHEGVRGGPKHSATRRLPDKVIRDLGSVGQR